MPVLAVVRIYAADFQNIFSNYSSVIVIYQTIATTTRLQSFPYLIDCAELSSCFPFKHVYISFSQTLLQGLMCFSSVNSCVSPVGTERFSLFAFPLHSVPSLFIFTASLSTLVNIISMCISSCHPRCGSCDFHPNILCSPPASGIRTLHSIYYLTFSNFRYIQEQSKCYVFFFFWVRNLPMWWFCYQDAVQPPTAKANLPVLLRPMLRRCLVCRNGTYVNLKWYKR